MIGLLPNEHHHYRLQDVARGLCASLGHEYQRSLEPIDLPGVGQCIPVRSGRAAIVVALRALGLAPGARVGVPLYCCPVVFKAVQAAGCRLRFLDVEPDTYCLSVADVKAKRADLDALIAVHMFGNLCDMPRLRDVLPNIPLIEDCAQSLGSRLDGRPCGVFGDLAFFSFRLGKYLSVGEGAALFTGRAELRARIRDIVSQLSGARRTEECAHVAETYMRALLRSKPLWGLIGVGLWRAYSRTVKYTSQSPLVLGRIYAADRATTVRRLPCLIEWVGRQRSHAAFYERHLRESWVDRDPGGGEEASKHYGVWRG
jgi:perosamine synthetase